MVRWFKIRLVKTITETRTIAFLFPSATIKDATAYMKTMLRPDRRDSFTPENGRWRCDDPVATTLHLASIEPVELEIEPPQRIPGEPSNDERASWAEAALRAFMRELFFNESERNPATAKPDNVSSAISDLIADVLHYADTRNFDPFYIHEHGRDMFEDERGTDDVGAWRRAERRHAPSAADLRNDALPGSNLDDDPIVPDSPTGILNCPQCGANPQQYHAPSCLRHT